jgi:3-methylfumaryl-CoA hydratase
MSTNAVKSAAIEEAEELIGRESSYDGVDDVSRNDIRRKLEVFCFDCPLYTDDAIAQAHGYRMSIAPGAMVPMWSLAAYWSPGDPPIFGPGLEEKDGSVRTSMPNRWKNGLNASSEIEFFEPAYPGDRLRTTTKLLEVKPRKTHLGEGVFLIWELAISKQSGEKVAVRRNASFRYDADSDAKQVDRSASRDEIVTDISAASPYNEPIDWSRQLRFDDVKVGDILPPFNLWLSYQRIVMSIAVDRMFSGIHHNRDFARAGGLDDIIFNTRGYDMLMELALRSWIGLDGRIVKIGPFRMRKAAHPGDTIVCSGQVTKVEQGDRGGQVSLAIWVDSSRGRGTLGEALVALP